VHDHAIVTRDGNNSTDDLLTNVAELVMHAVRRVQRGAEIAPRLLDVDDSARYLSMSDKAVRELISQGELAYIQKVPGRSPYLLDIRDLDRWIERSKIFLAESNGSR
jgi:excisionase family DNA binding protein